MIILPRQARDKHRENSKRGPFFPYSYFPTHDYDELKFFKSRWATLNVVLEGRMRMRNNENSNTEGALYNPNSVVNFNPARQPKQWCAKRLF